jgi:type II secretory pathway pseudopilin PulG
MTRQSGDRARSLGRLRGDDPGFTLVEAVVSLLVLGIVFSALAVAAMGAIRASFTARVEQQGIDFATQALEKARALEYGALAMTASDLTGDPRIVTCGSAKCIDPGTGVQEQLIVAAAGGIPQHIQAIASTVSNEVPITVATYVTDPQDVDAIYKRVTVVASWSVAGNARTRQVSSLVAETTRGLPIPVFKLTPIGDTSQSVNPGADAVFGFELTNQGAPDRWNLELSGAGSGQWSLYGDDGNRAWDDDPLVDVPLTNTNDPEDAIIDTGRIDPTASVVFWAVREVPSGTPAGDSWSALSATSTAQAASPSGTASVDLLVRVTEGPVAGGPGGGQVSAVPGAPTNLQLTTADGSLGAAWVAPASAGSSAITDYVVSYKLSGSGAWTVFADGVSTTTSATITGLANNTTYDISVAAKNSAGLGPVVTAQGTPEAAVVYEPPTTCPASPAAPTVTPPSKYTVKQFALHNRSAANPGWPGTGVPAATSTTGQGLPLVAAVDGPQVPAGTTLPVYSSDLEPTVPGRVLNAGGSLTSSSTASVVDWRSTVAGKSYQGTLVVMLWVAAVPGDEPSLPWSLTAQPYYANATGVVAQMANAVTVNGAANSLSTGCPGWQQVWMSFAVNRGLKKDEYLGVRLWHGGDAGKLPRLRLAYDVVGDFPAAFTVPER